jgi:O-antigen ligase
VTDVWLLLVMILIMPFEKSPYFYISPSFLGLVPDFTVIKLLGMVGFAWALVQMATRPGAARIFGSPQARLFGVLFVGVLVSATLNSSAMFAITKYLVFLMFLPFVLIAVRTEDDVRRVVCTMVIGLTIIFPYALRQVGRYSGRLGVGLYEPNYLAANLVLVIPLAFAIASLQPTLARRWLWTGAGIVLVGSVFLTSSRGGFLGLLTAGTLFAYRRIGLKGAAGILLVLILAVLPTELGQRSLATLMRDTEAPPGLEASNRAHTALFWGGVRMMMDAPIFGVGPQRFKDYSRAYSGLDVSYVAHNTYLELGAEAGLPILLLFVLLIATSVGRLGRVARLRAGPDARALAAWADALRTGLVGFSVSAAFISAQYEKFFWVVVFLSIVISRLAAERTGAAAVPAAAGAIGTAYVTPHTRGQATIPST